MAPFLLRRSLSSPSRPLAGQLLFWFLISIGASLITVASLIWLSGVYGADIAFLIIGLVYILMSAALLFYMARKREIKAQLDASTDSGFIMDHLPDTLKSDPNVRQVLQSINQHPVISTAVAAFVGIVIAREFFDDDD